VFKIQIGPHKICTWLYMLNFFLYGFMVEIYYQKELPYFYRLSNVLFYFCTYSHTIIYRLYYRKKCFITTKIHIFRRCTRWKRKILINIVVYSKNNLLNILSIIIINILLTYRFLYIVIHFYFRK